MERAYRRLLQIDIRELEGAGPGAALGTIEPVFVWSRLYKVDIPEGECYLACK